MALRVPAAMALFLLLSLMAVAHCVVVVPHEESADGEKLLRLPSREDSAVPDEVVPVEEEEAVPVEPVAEPDPDRSNPDSVDDGMEELTAEKLSIEGQEDGEKTEEQIHDDEDDEEETKEKEKKGKNQHGDDRKGKKEKKMKKHHQSDDEEEEKTKKKIHHHRPQVEKENTKKRPCHHKSRSSNGDDSDDEDDKQEKKAKRWRKKAISRSMFGHGRRSQREEAAKEEVKN